MSRWMLALCLWMVPSTAVWAQDVEAPAEASAEGSTAAESDAASEDAVQGGGPSEAVLDAEQPSVEPAAPRRLRDVETAEDGLRWLAASDRRGRRFAGLAQIAIGSTVTTLGTVGLTTPLDLGWGSPSRQALYYGAMISLGTSTVAAGILNRMHMSRMDQWRALELLEEGAGEEEIREYVANRALLTRRGRIMRGITAIGFGIAAVLAIETVSPDSFQGDSMRITVIFGGTTILGGTLTLALRSPEERLHRHLTGLPPASVAPAALVQLSPTGFRVIW